MGLGFRVRVSAETRSSNPWSLDVCLAFKIWKLAELLSKVALSSCMTAPYAFWESIIPDRTESVDFFGEDLYELNNQVCVRHVGLPVVLCVAT